MTRTFDPKRKSAAPHRGPPRERREDETVRLYGLHAVEAALMNEARVIGRLLMTENAGHKLSQALAHRKATPERASPRELDRILGPDTVHQGVMLETQLLDEPDFETIAEAARQLFPIQQPEDKLWERIESAIKKDEDGMSAEGSVSKVE